LDATIIGTNLHTSIDSAAFINGTLAHALDMDDSAAGTVAHPSSMLVPALFALSEKQRASGKEFLTAYITGLEVFYRIALASDGQMKGWHRTSVFGALATAAAVAKLLNLAPLQIATAIGIAASMASGVQVNFGSMSKAVQVGNASRSGLLAALLARDGCSASQDALGDSIGFGYAFYNGHFKMDLITQDFGNPYSVIFPGIGLKKYPCCGLTHSTIDLVLELSREQSIDVNDVESVTVTTEVLTSEVLTYHRPKTGYQGKYSLEFVVAAALHDGEITADSFTDESVNRPTIQHFLANTTCEVRSDSYWQSMRLHSWNHPAEVSIYLKNGQSFQAQAPCARGYPDLALGTDDVHEKFADCASSLLSEGAINQIKQKVLRFEDQTDIKEVIQLTSYQN
jgi:2-methylcitrate dehydratase PrpD